MLQRGFKWCHRGSDVFYMKASFAKTDMSVFIFLNHVFFFCTIKGKSIKMELVYSYWAFIWALVFFILHMLLERNSMTNNISMICRASHWRVNCLLRLSLCVCVITHVFSGLAVHSSWSNWFSCWNSFCCLCVLGHSHKSVWYQLSVGIEALVLYWSVTQCNNP